MKAKIIKIKIEKFKINNIIILFLICFSFISCVSSEKLTETQKQNLDNIMEVPLISTGYPDDNSLFWLNENIK